MGKNPLKALAEVGSLCDWMTPTAEAAGLLAKALKPSKSEGQELSPVDPELLDRLLNEPKQPAPRGSRHSLVDPPTSEWMCDYCHTPQPMANRKCDSCGGSRSFIR